MYSSGVGRWLTPDPVRACPLHPQKFDRYAYVGNSPTNRTDPHGDAVYPGFAYPYIDYGYGYYPPGYGYDEFDYLINFGVIPDYPRIAAIRSWAAAMVIHMAVMPLHTIARGLHFLILRARVRVLEAKRLRANAHSPVSAKTSTTNTHSHSSLSLGGNYSAHVVLLRTAFTRSRPSRQYWRLGMLGLKYLLRPPLPPAFPK